MRLVARDAVGISAPHSTAFSSSTQSIATQGKATHGLWLNGVLCCVGLCVLPCAGVLGKLSLSVACVCFFI